VCVWEREGEGEECSRGQALVSTRDDEVAGPRADSITIGTWLLWTVRSANAQRCNRPTSPSFTQTQTARTMSAATLALVSPLPYCLVRVWILQGSHARASHLPWTRSDKSYAVRGSCVSQGQGAVLSVGCG
jgi:hypothetical protein